MRRDPAPFPRFLTLGAALCALLTAPGLARAQEAALSAEAEAEANALRLEEIFLQGSSYETEHTGSYTTDLLSVGDKDTRYQREIPQSTTVLTRQRLEDGNFTSLDSALRKTPGVMVLANDDGRSSIYSRGFEFDSFSMNGLPTPLSSLHGTQPDMVVFDHVEVLRGPSGLFTGSGEPAGAINMRLKQPTDEFQLQFSAIGGSWNNRRLEGDVSGPLNAEGTIRGRLVGAWGARDSWMDNVDNEVGVIYGTLQADLTPDTTATASIHHRQREITPTNGLPTLANGVLLDVPTSTYTGADWNFFENKATDYLLELEHRFADGGHAKVSGIYTQADALMHYAFVGSVAAANGNVTLAQLARDYDQKSFALDAHVSKPFELLGLEQNLILGADHRADETTILNMGGAIAGVTNNVYAWNTAIPKPAVVYAAPQLTDMSQYGVYGQWRVKPVQDVTAILGGRLSWHDNKITGEKLNAEFTPYAGLIWDFNDRASAYGSYTEIFQPQATLKPRTGRQFELGVKADLFEDVNASLAYFNILDRDRAVRDPLNPASTTAYAAGEANLQGVEFEITGSITPNLSVSAGYTYTDSAYANTQRPTTNMLEYYAPRHMAQVWTKYEFDESHGALEGAWVGAGFKAFSEYDSLIRLQNGTTQQVNSPGYAVIDLAAGYQINDNWDVSLSLNNVLDKKYYERVHGYTTFNFYGEPRSAQVRLNAKF